jgi:hypothetical protein
MKPFSCCSLPPSTSPQCVYGFQNCPRMDECLGVWSFFTKNTMSNIIWLRPLPEQHLKPRIPNQKTHSTSKTMFPAKNATLLLYNDNTTGPYAVSEDSKLNENGLHGLLCQEQKQSTSAAMTLFETLHHLFDAPDCAASSNCI